MEETLCHNHKYKFVLLSRTFVAVFDKIEGPTNTLVVTEYTDDNGTVPGTRTLPFSWIQQVELISTPTHCDIDTIEMSTSSIVKKRKKKNKTPEFVNNFTV